jgi:ABC-2 type transport system permease protein
MSTMTQARTLARPAGFVADIATVATRALRSILRDPEVVIPGLIMGVFFYGVHIGALQHLAETIPGMDYKAFTLPVAILFAITGLTRAMTLVIDIQTGYFDRLSLTPVNRLSLLLGLMVADLALVVALTLPVLALGLITGVRFASGPVGMLAFIAMSGLWGLAFAGFPYAIALKTGNPAAVNMTFLLFLPFMFFTTAFLPIEVLTGWMAAIATYNPVTYLLDALRSLVTEGWVVTKLAQGLLAIAAVWAVSLMLALTALRGRVRRK